MLLAPPLWLQNCVYTKIEHRIWLKKFEDNVTRDSRTREALIGLGWRVFVVWECELGSQQKVSGVAMRLREQFLSDSKALHCIKVVSDRFEPEYLPGSGKI